jgi:hypothetical protein
MRLNLAPLVLLASACVRPSGPSPSATPASLVRSEPGPAHQDYVPVLGLELGLPEPPAFDIPEVPLMAEDGTWSILGLRRMLAEMLPEAEAGRVVLVSAYVQEVYEPPACREGERCPRPKQPHAWIVDDPAITGKQNAMLVPGTHYAIPEWDRERQLAWASEPDLVLEPGRRYVFMGWLRRFSDTGFAHDRGLLELFAVANHPLGADPKWIIPRYSPFHPKDRAEHGLAPLAPELAHVPAGVIAGAPLPKPGPLIEPIDRAEAGKLAREEASAGRPGRSDYYHRWLIVDDPSVTWTWVELGNMYLDNGEFEAGLAILDLAIERFPSDYAVHNGRGRLLLNAGDPAAAVESYRRAAELASDAPDVWFGLGMAYAELGQAKQAIEALKRFLALADEPEAKVPEHVIRAAHDTILSMTALD